MPSSDAACADVPDLAPELRRWVSLAGAGVAVAHFAGFDADERFLVVLGEDEPARPALSTVALRGSDAGAPVVVAPEAGDWQRPVIIGRLQPGGSAPGGGTLVLEAQKLLLQGQREIELRCGEASIVLTRAGKVLIRGSYVLSRSRGANRIKGAHVEIN